MPDPLRSYAGIGTAAFTREDDMRFEKRGILAQAAVAAAGLVLSFVLTTGAARA